MAKFKNISIIKAESGEIKGVSFEITEGGHAMGAEEFFSILQLCANLMVKLQTGKIEWGKGINLL